MMLNAVICVWNDEDIIEATIKHLFAQGCSNVFIIDNFSTDDTVKNAICAGAILADSFNSKYFDELEKIYHTPFAIDDFGRDQWMHCMRRAMDELPIEPELKKKLDEALWNTADFMRNR